MFSSFSIFSVDSFLIRSLESVNCVAGFVKRMCGGNPGVRAGGMTIEERMIAAVIVSVCEAADQGIGVGNVPISIFITAVSKERHRTWRVRFPAESAPGSADDLDLVPANPEKSSDGEGADSNIII